MCLVNFPYLSGFCLVILFAWYFCNITRLYLYFRAGDLEVLKSEGSGVMPVDKNNDSDDLDAKESKKLKKKKHRHHSKHKKHSSDKKEK